MLKVTDIPSYFNLGLGRSVILRCLEMPPDSTVLELGAGCGAITRYLGETFARVDAIEGNAIRAEITRERCRDLDNVSILCRDLATHQLTARYDLVVIIGVLEYAPVHIFPEEPPRSACLRFLNLARKALTPNGRLVLAIENRIGLDYWAGTPEPHTGRPYDGIHQYPHSGSQVTFSREELQVLLTDAGFSHTSFYFCFPDYHFTRTILSSIGDERDHFLHNWVEFPADTAAGRTRPQFSKLLATQGLAQSKLLREFANAFLVLAGTNDIPSPDWAAKVYNMNRKEALRNVTTLYLGPEPFVRKSPMPSSSTICIEPQSKQQTADVVWSPGSLLTFEVERASLTRHFSGYVLGLMQRYDYELRRHFSTGSDDPEGFPLLKAASLDAVLTNIIEDRHGEWVFIDDELLTTERVPIDLVLYRCIRFCLFRYGVSDRQARSIIRSLYPSYSRRRHSKNRIRADSIHREMILDLINPKLLRRSLLMRIARSKLCRSHVEKAWFSMPHGLRSFIRRQL